MFRFKNLSCCSTMKQLNALYIPAAVQVWPVIKTTNSFEWYFHTSMPIMKQKIQATCHGPFQSEHSKRNVIQCYLHNAVQTPKRICMKSFSESDSSPSYANDVPKFSEVLAQTFLRRPWTFNSKVIDDVPDLLENFLYSRASRRQPGAEALGELPLGRGFIISYIWEWKRWIQKQQA